MIHTITLNPTLDRTLTIERFHVGGTFKASRCELHPAGKGINVARVAATLGAPVVAVALVGAQDQGAFAAALAEAHVIHALYRLPGRTRNSITILDPLDRTETHLREEGTVPSSEAMSWVEDRLAQVEAGDWVVFAGSLPPEVPAEMYRDLVRACARRGAHTVLDTSGPALLAGVDAPPTLLKPNLFELGQIDRCQPDVAVEKDLTQLAIDDVLAAARRVQCRGVEIVVVSLGERGVLGLDADGRAWHASVTLEQTVVDAVGSGDALAAGLVVALARGEPFSSVLRLGVACGAANTLVSGAGCCRAGDVERLAARAVVTPLDGRHPYPARVSQSGCSML